MKVYYADNLQETTVSLLVDPNDQIYKVKEKIQEIEDIPPVQQRLLLGEEQLKDWRTLFDYNIGSRTTFAISD